MTTLFMLSIILIACVLAPIICHFIPHRLLPEVVVLLLVGILLGPHMLNLIQIGEELSLLSDIGMAFLFLLAGYEVDQRDLVSKAGRTATFTWLVSLLLSLILLGVRGNVSPFSLEGAAAAIAMTATALGTILPILKDRDLLGTPQGRFIMAQGAVGEVGPILLMALVLSANSALISLGLVVVFILVTCLLAYLRVRIVEWGSRLVRAVHFEAETTAQVTIRMVAALMVLLVAFAAGLGIDLVLGAFAAGFIVRHTVPDGHERLDLKLDGIAYGFFIPIFFVSSGTTIDPQAVVEHPVGWLLFLVALIAVRGLPVFVSSYFPMTDDLHKKMSFRQRLSAAFYATTNLPSIVAVTHLAQQHHVMSPTTASTLVFAGTASVLVMPLLAFLFGGPAGERKRKLA